jgi:maspardin
MIPSSDFNYFRSIVALQRINIVQIFDEKIWKFYDYGPKDVPPLILLPGVSGTAEIFYKQFLSLCPKGYRLISVQYPTYMTHESWCEGFNSFLDKIKVDKVHLFGTSIGGFLAQRFIKYRHQRVLSLILCNSFSDTSYYKDNAPCAGMFPLMPEFVLKRMILSNFPTSKLESEIANSVDFMVKQLETLTQSELASRLTLNCLPSNFNPTELQFNKAKITIIDCLDEVAVPEKVRDEMYKMYPEARVAELKTGGNFPYLSRSDETNLYIEVHLRSQGLVVNKPILSSEESSTKENNKEHQNEIKEE